ncbi:hypothetical protein AVEN_68777-1 [Araneus ventricosus]|uniref:Integrase zinc-binding domain-containing protein n=1 Tax=Araneus ventricosus TaxID=182803 RepID=A0A4Y2C5Q1_ARAVE|nr:hypothetical protein AVEN_68777-1 [Araneus ventricosus]
MATISPQEYNSRNGGHFGVLKTLSKTRERFYWYPLSKDVEKWCRVSTLAEPEKNLKQERSPEYIIKVSLLFPFLPGPFRELTFHASSRKRDMMGGDYCCCDSSLGKEVRHSMSRVLEMRSNPIQTDI